MARRKLPWAADARADEKLHVAIPRSEELLVPARTPKRERPEEDCNQDTLKQSPQSEPIQKRRRRAASRSPSTSPPPAPPKIHRMIEGYGYDDDYMMVEDEFYTVAQSFTAHLHHAEYKRLMLKAQQAPPRPLPELSASMSHLTKQKIARRKLELEQKAALRELGTSTVVEERKDDTINEAITADSWQGTSLGVLMASASQHKTSLVGLDKIPSTTRAAKGYRRGESDSQLRSRKGISNTFDIFKTLLTANKAEDDDDDQELVFTDKTKAECYPGTPRTESLGVKSSMHGKSKGESELSPRSGTTNTKKLSILKGFDDYDGSILDPPSPPAARPKAIPKSGPKRQIDIKKDRRSRLDEVPVFL